MKPRTLLISILLASLLASCAAAPPPAQPKVAASSKETRPRPLRPGSELGSKTFAELPTSLRSYLMELAEAFSAGDREKLIRQGEAGYEKRVRPRVDPNEYLALLYRAGAYAEEHPLDDSRPSRLDTRKIVSLSFTGWSEKGPVIAVRGKLRLGDGQAVPCVLNVLWKLEPPKLIGWEP